jgi:hypothetical protein
MEKELYPALTGLVRVVEAAEQELALGNGVDLDPHDREPTARATAPNRSDARDQGRGEQGDEDLSHRGLNSPHLPGFLAGARQNRRRRE